MKLLKFARMSLIALLGLAMMACQEKSSQSDASGGIDGSGGDTVQVTKQSFIETHKYLPTYVRLTLVKLDALVRNKDTYNPEVMKLINLLSSIDVAKDVERVTWVVKDQFCLDDENEKKSGAADLKRYEICTAYGHFSKMSEEEMRKQLVSLGLHEYSHLHGFNEEEAVNLQRYLFENWEFLGSSYSEEKMTEVQLAIFSLKSKIIDAQKAVIQNKRGYLCTDYKNDLNSEHYLDGSLRMILRLPSIRDFLFDQFYKSTAAEINTLCENATIIPAVFLRSLFTERYKVLAEKLKYLNILNDASCNDPHAPNTPICFDYGNDYNKAVLDDQLELKLNQKPLLPIDGRSVECDLQDEMNNKQLKFNLEKLASDNGISYPALPLKTIFNISSFTAMAPDDETDESAFKIFISDNVVATEFSHGLNLGYSFGTWLQKGIRESATVKFDVYTPPNVEKPQELLGRYTLSCHLQ